MHGYYLAYCLSCLPYLATFSNERLEAQNLCCALTVRVRQYGPQEICNNIVIKLHSQSPEIVKKKTDQDEVFNTKGGVGLFPYYGVIKDFYHKATSESKIYTSCT